MLYWKCSTRAWTGERAMLGPFHFHRLAHAGIGEAPAAFRRRTVTDVPRELGVRDVETRAPIEWERATATRSWPARGARVEHHAIEATLRPARQSRSRRSRNGKHGNVLKIRRF
jgi:hypothetical protein